MIDASIILSRLEGVKQVGNGSWVARCPAHKDKSPSLSIAERDGRLLIHDFAGCEPIDVLQSIGLDFQDLFDRDDKPAMNNRQRAKFMQDQSLKSAMMIGAQETTIVAIAAGLMAQGRKPGKKTMARLEQAKKRLFDIRDTFIDPDSYEAKKVRKLIG